MPSDSAGTGRLRTGGFEDNRPTLRRCIWTNTPRRGENGPERPTRRIAMTRRGRPIERSRHWTRGAAVAALVGVLVSSMIGSRTVAADAGCRVDPPGDERPCEPTEGACACCEPGSDRSCCCEPTDRSSPPDQSAEVPRSASPLLEWAFSSTPIPRVPTNRARSRGWDEPRAAPWPFNRSPQVVFAVWRN